MRIDRVLSNLKYGSRKEIQSKIKNQQLFINNCLITNIKHQVYNSDNIVFENENVFFKEEINLLLNKPINYLSANKDNLHKTVIDLIKKPYDRYDFKIAGRLDIDSQGMLILTTSGKFAHIITSPNNKIPKTYIATLDREININELNLLLIPHLLKDPDNKIYTSKALDVKLISNNICQIVIDMGKFHQVKKMFEHIGFKVINLKRTKIGNLFLPDNLDEGDYIEFERSMLCNT